LLAEWQALVARCAYVLDDDVLVEHPVPVAE